MIYLSVDKKTFRAVTVGTLARREQSGRSHNTYFGRKT